MDPQQAQAMVDRLVAVEAALATETTARQAAEAQIATVMAATAASSNTGGRVVDTRVLGRPEKWDGSAKTWPDWSFVVKAYAGAIDSAMAADMTVVESAGIPTLNTTMSPRTQQRSVQLYFILIMLCVGKALDRLANVPQGNGMEAWRMLYMAYAPKDYARLVVMMLEVLAYPLDANDIINSLESMERKLKEFEKHAEITIPEFLKIGIVIRQAEGALKQHLIMNAHRLKTFDDIKKEVTNVRNAQIAAKVKSGDAMDVDAFAKGGGKGKDKGKKGPCFYCGKDGHMAKDCRKKAADSAKGLYQPVKGGGKASHGGGGKAGGMNHFQKEFTGKCYKCGKKGHIAKNCKSKEAGSLEASGASPSAATAEADCLELNVLEIGAMLQEGKQVRIGVDSCAAVTVFPKHIAVDYPISNTPGKAKSYRPASGAVVPDLGTRKVQVRLSDGSQRIVNPRIADTHRALMAVSEMNDMGHDVFFPRTDRDMKAYAYHEATGTKMELERRNGIYELAVDVMPYSSKDKTKEFAHLSALDQITEMVAKLSSSESPNVEGRASQ